MKFTKRLLTASILSFCLTPTFAEDWKNAGVITWLATGQLDQIDRKRDVYGDKDSIERMGDIASMMVMGIEEKPKKFTFECLKNKGSIVGAEFSTKQDIKTRDIFIPASVFTNLHTMACKKIYEFWK